MKQPVKEFFDQQVDSYSSNFAAHRTGSHFRFLQRTKNVSELSKDASGKLLDCAVGTGEVAVKVLSSDRFTHAELVDISPNMLDYAKSLFSKANNLPEYHFIESDIFSFLSESPDEKYDLILCVGLIAHTARLALAQSR